jgi:hypothetical protein
MPLQRAQFSEGARFSNPQATEGDKRMKAKGWIVKVRRTLVQECSIEVMQPDELKAGDQAVSLAEGTGGDWSTVSDDTEVHDATPIPA